MSTRKRGFTLIELLVVISVIALLLSVMIPSLSRAKESARSVVCRTNLHSYGIALVAYLQDWENCFPYPWTSFYKDFYYSDPSYHAQHSLYCRWHDAEANNSNRPENAYGMWPYLDAKKGHLCATFASYGKKFGNEHSGHDPAIPVDPQYSYSQNSLLGNGSHIKKIAGSDAFKMNNGVHSRTDYGVQKMSQVKSPSRTFSFSEENPWPNPNQQSEVQGWQYGGEQGMNDNALVMNWYWPGGVDMPFSSGGRGQVSTGLNLRGMRCGPDTIATFHKTSASKKEEGVANMVMLDGSVGQGKAIDTMYYAWPN